MADGEVQCGALPGRGHIAADAGQLAVMGRQHCDQTAAAGQFIYMPGQGVYAIGVQNQRQLQRQQPTDQGVGFVPPAHAAADGRRVTPIGAAAQRRLRVQGEPALRGRQREGHGLVALYRRDGPDLLGHTQEHQPAAAPNRAPGAQHRRTHIAHAAAQQADLAECALVARRVSGGQHAFHIVPVDGKHGIPPLRVVFV